MATAAVSNGTTATITFSSGFFAKIKNIGWGGMKRKAIDTTAFGVTLAGAGKTGNATFIPGRVNDPGELTIEGFWNPDTLIPMEAIAETTTLTVGDSTTPATIAGSAFMTSFEVGVPFEDAMTFRATVKFSGNVTKTSGT